MSNEPRKDGLFHSDGTRSTNFAGLHHRTPEQVFEEFKMKIKPHECPPIFHSDGRTATDKFVQWATNLTQGQGEISRETIAHLASGFAAFSGQMNVAAYVSSAINNTGGEIAESLNRLARAVENLTPTVEPPVLLTLRNVARRVGLWQFQIKKLIKAGEFPQPIDVAGSKKFLESDINQWLTTKANQ
jgi:predicted DNA-binding transcriptional regulator AlpA